MIDRSQLFEVLKTRLEESRALALIGARQVGKTTLARGYAHARNCAYFDLEDPQSLESLAQPLAMFETLLAQGRTVVIDEVQRRPDLFPLLRTLIDRHARAAQFLLLGSTSPLLMRQSGESLATISARNSSCGLLSSVPSALGRTPSKRPSCPRIL